MSLREAWEDQADRWIVWARRPGHDSYWAFHREAFLPLVPPPGRLTVDLGCGEGRVSRDLRARGHAVVALDRSETLCRAARGADGGPTVRADAAALPLADASADCVVAFMSLQDVDDLEGTVAEVGRVLEAGGRFVLAVVHPVNSAGDFRPGDDDPPFVIPGSYLTRRRRSDAVERNGLEMRFDSEHRPLQDYAEALAGAGFLIERLREPTEPLPTSKWSRIPLFLNLRAVLGGETRPSSTRGRRSG